MFACSTGQPVRLTGQNGGRGVVRAAVGLASGVRIARLGLFVHVRMSLGKCAPKVNNIMYLLLRPCNARDF